MNRTLKTSLYISGGVVGVILLNALVKQMNSGIGFFTTDKKMGKLVGMSSEGQNVPYTKDNIDDFLETWISWGKNYRRAYYKAVWRSEKGKPTPYFYVDKVKHATKGGRRA